MASLTRKRIHGRTYYYARICKRVDGKPKIVRTIYLGTVDKIIQNAERGRTVPQAAEVHLAELGATAALIDVAERLQFVQIVDRHAPKRGQGPSVGQYMLIAALNRAIHPTSKASLAEWFSKTVGPRLMGVRPKQLSSQAFWNHMERLKPPRLARIEEDLFARLLEEFGIDVSCLLYDATNFYTYINTKTHSKLAQRGHNKQKRNDLRQVSLGLMTTSDFHVPLLHLVYGGNINDATEFGSVIEQLVQRYRHLAEACGHVTVIFDKGNNSEANLRRWSQTGLHFVGSLRLNQCSDVLTVPLRAYRRLEADDLQSVWVYRQRRKVFAEERTVLVTYNENLLEGQLQGIGRNLAKTRKELRELQGSLRRWAEGKIRRGKKPTLAAVQRKVDKMLRREHMKEILPVRLETVQGFVRLSYTVDPNAISRLSRTVLGKTILFTDNEEWSDEQIVRGYRGQYHIEHAFREMKNPHVLGWNPRFHWTDDKIRVHAFYCVAALTLVSLLRRQLAAGGVPISAERLMTELSGIQETLSVYPRGKNKKPALSHSMTHLNEMQKALYDLLNLDRFRSV